MPRRSRSIAILVAAILCVGGLESPQLLEALAPLLQHGDVDVRASAAAALGQLGPLAAEALPLLRDAVLARGGSTSAGEVQSAARFLTQARDRFWPVFASLEEKAVRTLMEILSAGDEGIRPGAGRGNAVLAGSGAPEERCANRLRAHASRSREERGSKRSLVLIDDRDRDLADSRDRGFRLGRRVPRFAGCPGGSSGLAVHRRGTPDGGAASLQSRSE
jgi:hypothetical protein